MKQFFERNLPGLTWRIRKNRLLWDLGSQRCSYLNVTGYLESHRTRSICDAEGRPIPWMNYSLIDLLEERLPDGLRIFEYGYGASTMYFARSAASMDSVEHDKQRCEEVKAQAPKTATIHFCDKIDSGDYASMALKRSVEGGYELIIVDGEDRIRCADRTADSLYPPWGHAF